MAKFEYTFTSHVTIVVEADNEEIAENFCLNNWDDIINEKYGNVCHKDYMLEEPRNVDNDSFYDDFESHVKVNADGTFETSND